MIFHEIVVPVHEQIVIKLSRTIADDSSAPVLELNWGPEGVKLEGGGYARGVPTGRVVLWERRNEPAITTQMDFIGSISWLLTDESPLPPDLRLELASVFMNWQEREEKKGVE